MKKRIIVFLAVFCFCLSGCGSPTDLLRGIDLPFVDFDSEEDSYASSEEETEEKETAETAEAEEAAKAAERAAAEQAAADQAAADEVVAMFDALPTEVTVDDKDTIEWLNKVSEKSAIELIASLWDLSVEIWHGRYNKGEEINSHSH